MEHGRDFLLLLRPRLSAMVSVSALAGWYLHPAPGGHPALAAVGVFLLAGGCTALNQVQERDLDTLMERTRQRPIPAGRLRPRTALLIALALMGTGLGFHIAAGLLPLLLGISAAVLYNGIYTPLKRRTFSAVLPGALCGALPPLIGWTAAGGALGDFRAILLAGLMFLWQVPHFWLFAERHKEDYRRANLPSPGQTFSPRQVGRLVFAWSAAQAGAALALAAFAMTHLPFSRSAILILSLLLLATSIDARFRLESAPTPLFRRVTAGMAMILIAILIGGWLAA